MYDRTVLSNGVRVVSHQASDRASVALGIWVGTGGRHEEDHIKGAAHFLEHIVFKGSRKYSCDQIKKAVEGVGGSLNAFTSEEQTCYYAKIPAVHAEKALDVLCDMVFRPTIAAKDVAKESGVILEELKMYHDLPQYYVLDLLDGLMWPGHPLGKSLIGTPESVSNIAKKDLHAFHRRNYRAGNVVISACGKLSHSALVRMLRARLGGVEEGGGAPYAVADNSQNAPRVNLYHKDTEQMHLALGMLGVDSASPDRYALALLHVILGGNMSSRLFDEVREKRGLAYSISSSLKYLRDTGMFMVRAGVDNSKIVDAAALILQELAKIRRRGVSDGEFKRARDYYLGQVLMGLEDTLDHMFWIGESTMVHDRIRTLKEVMAFIRKISISDVKRVADAVLREDRLNLALIGPVTDEQKAKLTRLLGISG